MKAEALGAEVVGAAVLVVTVLLRSGLAALTNALVADSAAVAIAAAVAVGDVEAYALGA